MHINCVFRSADRFWCVRTAALLSCLVRLQCATPVVAAVQAPFRVIVTVDFEPDRGENPGTLFEITDASGRVVAGAGFLGAYNTAPRSEREQLQFFLRPAEPLKERDK